MGNPCGNGSGSKEMPLIRVMYPNENKSHEIVNPVEGQPGVDPCCKPSLYPDDTQGASLCDPVACNAGAHDQTAPGACYDATSLHQKSCDCNSCQLQRKQMRDSGQPCYQHVEGNEYQDLSKSHWNPEVERLRERMKSSCNMKENLKWCPTDDSLTCVVRKFRQYPVGIIGQASVHYGAAQDQNYPEKLTHGALSNEVTPGTKLINPPVKTLVQQLDQDIKESIYLSHREQPLGRSHDQTKNLPPHVNPQETSFGIPSDKSISASLLINPPKTRFEIDEEVRQSKALYKLSHGDYDAGEQVCRNYEHPFSRTRTFGKQTPSDVAGRWVKKVLYNWRSCESDLPYVSKVYADHAHYRLHRLGETQQENCIAKSLPEDFTYGARSEPEKERPIREILFNRSKNEQTEYEASLMQNLKNWIYSVRKYFKGRLAPDFENFYEDLLAADKSCQGLISWDEMTKVMISHKVPRMCPYELFQQGLAMAGVFQCDKVNVYGLMDLLKGYNDPGFSYKTTTLTPFYCPHTNGSIHFRTSYADMAANMCAPQTHLQQLKEGRMNGMPSVRTDRRPNKIRSTKDTTNYGDDGDAYSLLFPSVYTANGVTIRDVFKSMTKEEMAKILCRAGVQMSHQELDTVWKTAEQLDPGQKSRVSFQTFREALCMVREEEAKIRNVHIEYDTDDCCRNPSNPPKIKRKPNPCHGVDP